MTEIIVALLTGAITWWGVLISNSRSQAVTDTKLEELTREVREHNGFAKRMPVLEEKIKVINHRIADLERGGEQEDEEKGLEAVVSKRRNEAVKTVAQTAVATIGTSAMLGDVNWLAVVPAAAMAGDSVPLDQRGGLPEYKERGVT